MPERNPTTKPTFIAGTNLQSGTPNTGQIQYTQGGQQTFCTLSGTAGGDANIWVGGGRVDIAQLHPWAASVQSGKPAVLYDAAAAVSGGPLATSGHKIVAVICIPNAGNQIGSGLMLGGQGFPPQQLGFVFTSGLCIASTSGMPGVTVAFTPVISG